MKKEREKKRRRNEKSKTEQLLPPIPREAAFKTKDKARTEEATRAITATTQQLTPKNRGHTATVAILASTTIGKQAETNKPATTATKKDIFGRIVQAKSKSYFKTICKESNHKILGPILFLSDFNSFSVCLLFFSLSEIIYQIY